MVFSKGTTSRVAEKVNPGALQECFVTGHDFSRAANPQKSLGFSP
jgi:hypothetical protein